MLRAILSFFGVIFTMGTLGAILGIIMLGAIFFAYSRDLPNYDSLATYEPATISRVYSIRGEVVDEFAEERRLFTPVEEIPDIVKQAFISAEDKNFYQHPGYDPAGIAKAIADFGMDRIQGRPARLRGASTITQQVAKNFLLDGSREIERKIKEIILATQIERTLTKDRILELYLNEIFLGQNSYGVTAAAETYFGKPIEKVTVEEAAYLAALPKAPSEFHPVRQKDRAIARRNFVIREMSENGYITENAALVARDMDILTVQGGDYASVRSNRAPRNYFTDEIRRQLSEQFGEEQFFTAGLSVRSTQDPELQAVAAAALRKGLERYDREKSPYRGPIAKISDIDFEDEAAWRKALSDLTIPRDIEGWSPAVVLSIGENFASIGIEGLERGEGQSISLATELKWAKNREDEDGNLTRIRTAQDLFDVGDVVFVKQDEEERWSLRQIPEVQGAFVAMDTNTGRVLAMQGGFSYQHSVFNRATQALRQPGSVFKPFVYAAALDSGYSPVSIVVDAPIEINTPQGLWRPKNASNKFYGPAPLRVGIEQSRNLMTIRLAEDVGMDIVGGYAERFGVYDGMLQVLAGALGAQESTLYRIVSAYAMFANGGERVQPTLVDRVQDRHGKTIFQHDKRTCIDCLDPNLVDGRSPWIQSNRFRVMDAVTAYQLTSMMRGVVQRGTASSTVRVPNVAGKTGTTNDAKDVWFVGFTRNIVAGCYIGFDQPEPLGRGASGGAMCGPVFNDFMKVAVEKFGTGKFTPPQNTVFYKFDRFNGVRLPDDASGEHVVAELFRAGEDPEIGVFQTIIDGGFASDSTYEIFSNFANSSTDRPADTQVTTSDGETKVIPGKTSFGSLSSGGVY